MSKKERAQYMHSLSPVDLSADSKLLISLYGRIAQLVRALASHARGRRFESYCDHHKNQPLACLMKAENPITVPLTVRVNIDYVPVLSRKASPTPSDVYWREQFSLDRVPTLIAR